MFGRSLAVALAMAVVPGGRLRAADRPPDGGVFGPTRVWQLTLTIPAEEYGAMPPAGGWPQFPGAPPAAPRPTPRPDAKPREVHKGGSFGLEFPWAHGDLTAEGRTYRNVGLRYKGGGSYMASAGRLRRNIKVDLNRYAAGQRFHGLKTLNLNAGAMDPSRLREAAAYAVYRGAGVPAPRTAFAEVMLTVPGKYDRELLGLYTLVEQVDKAFLKAHFQSGDGLLLKPEVRPGGPPRGPLSYAGEDWKPYREALRPKREPTKAEAARVIAFTRLIDRADDEQFRREVGDYLDVDGFLRFLAVTALLAHTDSFFVGGHNTYIYLNPATNKFAFVPWDLDLAFSGCFLLGPPDQQADLSLTHPYPGENRLVDRLMATPEVRARYLKIVRELTATAFGKDRLLATIGALEKAAKEPLARERKAAEARREGPGGFGMGFGPPPDLRRFVARRSESVAAQLAGRSRGTIPTMGFGPGGGPRPTRSGEILSPAAQGELRLTDAQRRRLAELQKELDGKLDELLTEGQRKQLREMRNRAPGGFSPQGGSGQRR